MEACSETNLSRILVLRKRDRSQRETCRWQEAGSSARTWCLAIGLDREEGEEGDKEEHSAESRGRLGSTEEGCMLQGQTIMIVRMNSFAGEHKQTYRARSNA